MAAHENGLKVISYAFKDISLDEFNEMMHKDHIESNEFRNNLEE